MLPLGLRLGVIYAQGSLFAEWLDVFGESRAKTSSVGTLATSVMEGSGLLSGVLIARFGERPCCLVGGVLVEALLLGGVSGLLFFAPVWRRRSWGRWRRRWGD